MANSLAQKLRIREGYSLLTLHAPAGFKKAIEGLPPGVTVSPDATRFDQVHWFVMNKTQLEKELKKILKLVKGEVICWIHYPKSTSGIQTDLNRDIGWDELLKVDLRFISLISFDETWSAFGIREKTEADRKKEAQPKKRPVFDYVDPKTKTVRLPDDLQQAMKNSRRANEFFDQLSFTNKKEYIEWVVTAKRDETRKERLRASVERLEKGWKNPRNL